MSFTNQYNFYSLHRVPNFVQNSGWAKRFKQVHRHNLMLDADQIPLSFQLHISIIKTNIRSYILLCSGTDFKQTART
jgi:hypothetical protein